MTGIVSKLKELRPEDVQDACEDLSNNIWSMRALGELIGSANLEFFNGSTEHSEKLQYGLQLLIEACIKPHEEKINELFERASNCPDRLIHLAENECEHIRRYNSTERMLQAIREKKQDMELIINQYGRDEYPEAEAALERLKALESTILHEKSGGKIDDIESRIDRLERMEACN